MSAVTMAPPQGPPRGQGSPSAGLRSNRPVAQAGPAAALPRARACVPGRARSLLLRSNIGVH